MPGTAIREAIRERTGKRRGTGVERDGGAMVGSMIRERRGFCDSRRGAQTFKAGSDF
jgi:hypothetical protein